MLKDALFKLIFDRALRAVQREDVPVAATAEQQVALAVANQVAPVLENQLNQEPLWKSRVIRGGLLVLLGAAGGFFGLQLSDGDAEQTIHLVSTLIEVGGAAYALYGRITSKPAPKI